MTHEVMAPDGRRLSIESFGDPDGLPVLLMHGTPGSRRGPCPREIVLYKLGIHLISYDRPGYPGSERQEGRDVADAANDVMAIADYLGIERLGVVGRSGGGPHALACAALLRDRVICAAALNSMAPPDSEGLDWEYGMAGSSILTYRDAEADPEALIATLNDRASQVRNNPESLLKLLWPELASHDKEIIGDLAFRRLLAKADSEALHDSADGWADDIVALRRPWGFDPSDIKAPVKLWSGIDDVFSPVTHTRWLEKRIPAAETEVNPDMAHFGSINIMPRILAWITSKAAMEQVEI